MLCGDCKGSVKASPYRTTTDLAAGIAVASNGLTALASRALKSFQQKEKTIIEKTNKLVYY